jgi:hypothetical protein
MGALKLEVGSREIVIADLWSTTSQASTWAIGFIQVQGSGVSGGIQSNIGAPGLAMAWAALTVPSHLGALASPSQL